MQVGHPLCAWRASMWLPRTGTFSGVFMQVGHPLCAWRASMRVPRTGTFSGVFMQVGHPLCAWRASMWLPGTGTFSGVFMHFGHPLCASRASMWRTQTQVRSQALSCTLAIRTMRVERLCGAPGARTFPGTIIHTHFGLCAGRPSM